MLASRIARMRNFARLASVCMEMDEPDVPSLTRRRLVFHNPVHPRVNRKTRRVRDADARLGDERLAHPHTLVGTAELKLHAVVAGLRALANGVAEDAVEE